MSTQSSAVDAPAADETVSTVLRAAAGIVGAPALSVRRLGRGRNNVTLLLETGQGPYVAKYYPATPGDQRDRFRAETAALTFMNANGIDCVPQLFGSDAAARVAVMDGSGEAAVRDAEDADIAACVAFAERLHAARRKPGAENIGPAAEACPAPEDVIGQVRARRTRLGEIAGGHQALQEFLNAAFDPAFAAYETAARDTLAAAGIAADAQLTRDRQTLSPSDFGMHNAVRREDGRLAFVDFEYFGWDDPVRLVSDFVLHPGHRLTNGGKQRFARACGTFYADSDDTFPTRLGALYPLVGLRWCMIVLNEFLPERMARRRATGNAGTGQDVLAVQLDKARRLLAGLEDSKGLLTD